MKFFTKIFLIIILVAGTIALIVTREKTVYDENNFYGALIDKNKLLESTPSPRIIFVGASNLAFGLDSKKIHDELGINVVNMGLHGDFGLDFILNDVKYNLKQGDIVVLAIEYYLDKIDYKTLSYAMHLYPEGEKFVNHNFDYYEQMAGYYVDLSQHLRKEFFNYVFGKVLKLKEAKVFTTTALNSYDTLIYSRHAFNSYGDVVSHLDKARVKDIHGRIHLKEEDYGKCIDDLNDFYDYVLQHGGKVLFTFPSYPQTEYEKNLKPIKNFEQQLKDGLKIPIIMKPEDTVFPDSLFFDTVYHLTAEGREMRTDKVINAIRKNSGLGIGN